MPKATHAGSTLLLNNSNHPSIPAPEGLELKADTPTPVTAEQAEYLKTLPNITLTDDPAPSRKAPAPAAPAQA